MSSWLQHPEGPVIRTLVIAALDARSRTGTQAPSGGERFCWSSVALFASRATRESPACCAADAERRPGVAVRRTKRLTAACPPVKSISIPSGVHVDVERYFPPSLPPDGPGLAGHAWPRNDAPPIVGLNSLGS